MPRLNGLLALPLSVLAVAAVVAVGSRASAQELKRAEVPVAPHKAVAVAAQATPDRHAYLVATSVAQMNTYGAQGWETILCTYNPIKKRMEWTMELEK